MAKILPIFLLMIVVIGVMIFFPYLPNYYPESMKLLLMAIPMGLALVVVMKS